MISLDAVVGVDYARISDDDTGKAAGVDRQARDNAALAVRRQITLAARFCDNSRSAAHDLDKRDDYRAMLAYINDHDVNYVIAWHPDRLLRSVTEGEEFISLCRRRGVLVLTKTAGEFDLATAYGRKAFRDAVNGASYESEHRGERVAEARADQALNGHYGGGVRPYGWGKVTDQLQRVRDRKTGEWQMRPFVDMTQHNEAEAREIRRMRDQLLAGVPMEQVIQDLNERGVPTASRADGRVIRKNGKETRHSGWNSRSIRQIVTAPRVAGHAVHGGKITKRNAWPEIISEDDRQALIVVLSDPTRKTAPSNIPRWLGSLIYRCGVCDDDDDGSGRTTMTVRHGAGGLAVYRCRAKGHNSIDAEALDDFVARVTCWVIRRDAADLVATADEVDVAALRAERKALAAKRKKLTTMFMADQIDAEQLASGTALADKRIAEIDAELVESVSSSPLTPFVDADDVAAVWESRTLGEKREILKAVMSVTIQPGGTRQVDPERVVTSEALSQA